MKKFLSIFIFLIIAPSIALGDNPAPPTEEALQKVIQAIAETPKEIDAQNISREEFHRQYFEYFSKVYENAGYSYIDTINRLVSDMKENPEAVRENEETVYNKLYIQLNIMLYECNNDQVDCLQFFPPETRESIQWFIENNYFTKHGSDTHHMSR